jgi:hypothetical protein
MVEEGARLVEDAERLTTNLGVLADILRETDYWARQAGADCMRAGTRGTSIQEWERVPAGCASASTRTSCATMS